MWAPVKSSCSHAVDRALYSSEDVRAFAARRCALHPEAGADEAVATTPLPSVVCDGMALLDMELEVGLEVQEPAEPPSALPVSSPPPCSALYAEEAK